MRSMCKALLETHTSTNFCNPCYNYEVTMIRISHLLQMMNVQRCTEQCTEMSSYWPKGTELLSSRTGFKCKQAGWLRHLCTSPLYHTADTVTRTFHCCCCRCLVAKSYLTLVTPWTVCSPQAPLSMRFSRRENWSGLPFPSPGVLPDPRIMSPALADGLLATEPPGKPRTFHYTWENVNGHSAKWLNLPSQNINSEWPLVTTLK